MRIYTTGESLGSNPESGNSQWNFLCWYSIPVIHFSLIGSLIWVTLGPDYNMGAHHEIIPCRNQEIAESLGCCVFWSAAVTQILYLLSITCHNLLQFLM